MIPLNGPLISPNRTILAMSNRPKKYRKGPPKPCILVGCERRHYAKGLCRSHWAHRQRTGDLNLKPQRRWTEAEDEILLAVPSYPSGRAEDFTVTDLAADLGRTRDAVTSRRHKLLAGLIKF